MVQAYCWGVVGNQTWGELQDSYCSRAAKRLWKANDLSPNLSYTSTDPGLETLHLSSYLMLKICCPGPADVSTNIGVIWKKRIQLTMKQTNKQTPWKFKTSQYNFFLLTPHTRHSVYISRVREWAEPQLVKMLLLKVSLCVFYHWKWPCLVKPGCGGIGGQGWSHPSALLLSQEYSWLVILILLVLMSEN